MRFMLRYSLLIPPILALLLAALPPDAMAESREIRFVSLRSDKVNLRAGPGTRYPVEWIYQRRALPVAIIAEFDTWRKVRGPDGTEGWVHQSLLSTRRTVVVLGELRTARRAPEREAAGVFRIEGGATARLSRCEGDWCLIEAERMKGWIECSALWGLLPGETVD